MGKPIHLVLGSGGARGLAHIGVIHELLERDFEIRSVTACSVPTAYRPSSRPPTYGTRWTPSSSARTTRSRPGVASRSCATGSASNRRR